MSAQNLCSNHITISLLRGYSSKIRREKSSHDRSCKISHPIIQNLANFQLLKPPTSWCSRFDLTLRPSNRHKQLLLILSRAHCLLRIWRGIGANEHVGAAAVVPRSMCVNSYANARDHSNTMQIFRGVKSCNFALITANNRGILTRGNQNVHVRNLTSKTEVGPLRVGRERKWPTSIRKQKAFQITLMHPRLTRMHFLRCNLRFSNQYTQSRAVEFRLSSVIESTANDLKKWRK